MQRNSPNALYGNRALAARRLADKLPPAPIPENLVPVSWADVLPGQTVYADSYQDGRYPLANPRILGPYTVNGRYYRTLINNRGQSFMHYPEDLLAAGTEG